MNRIGLTRTNCAFAACLLAMLGAAPALAANLAPHRAFYTLEAARLDTAGGISSISGKLAYEITGSDCEGYSTNYRIANRFLQGEGEPQVSDTRLTAWESGDGMNLDMRQSEYVNATLNSQSQVKVEKPAPDAAGKGTIVSGENKSFTTDPAAIFPTAFQKRLLDDAKAGKTRDDSIVFEGSDGEKAMRVITFIGARKDGSPIQAEADPSTLQTLGQTPYWPMTVSYYEIGAQGDDPPIYQATFNLLENGVSTDLVLDYGSYALKGRLSKIELLKAQACN